MFPNTLRRDSTSIMRALLLILCTSVATAQPNISAACQKTLDAYCNVDKPCVTANVKKNYTLPLVARFDRSLHDAAKAWRCYSPSSLSPDRSHYTHGSAYCSGTSLPALVAMCQGGHGGTVVTGNFTLVFTNAEIERCGYIRTPQPATLANGTIVLFAQCRNAAVTVGNNGAAITLGQQAPLKDDFRKTRMVVKSSDDGGVSWGPMRFVSEISTGVGAAIFDRLRDTLVFQYQTMPNPDPYQGNTLWQKVSKDGGATWSVAVNITKEITSCQSPTLEMVCGAAGSRIQTKEGRLVWAGHNKNSVCVWYSDDGGKTYKTSASFEGNEISIAELPSGQLYMNGRGGDFRPGHRVSWISNDAGETWSTPNMNVTLSDVNCEAAVIVARDTLFFSEPLGPGRVSFRISCSCDGGTVWNSSLTVNPGAGAQYSALVPLDGGKKLLAIWEDHPNQRSGVFGTEWCQCLHSH
jgi:hypothetical protein